MSDNKAWATLLTRTSYLAGCLVLAASLQAVKTTYPLVVFVTPSLPEEARNVLRARGLKTREIEYLEPEEGKGAKFEAHDERFHETWTKLRVFELVEYDRVVLLDSDMLVLRNMDELMEDDLPDDHIAAVHACTCNPRKLAHYPKEWIPENCAHTVANGTTPLPASDFTKSTHTSLNSGLVVLHPSLKNFNDLAFALHNDPLVATFKFPDQDLLAHVFKGRFRPLGWQYNALKTLRNCHKNIWRDDEAKNVHYIIDKPWQSRDIAGHENEETHRWWWQAYDELEKSWGSTEGWELVASTVAPKK